MPNNSWFVLQDPAGNRELRFQRTGSTNAHIIRYSFEDGFTGGGLTTAPTATDQVTIFANSTNTTGESWYTSSNRISHMGASDEDGYAFFLVTSTVSSNIIEGGVFYMDELMEGSYQDGYDIDPVVFYIGDDSGSLDYTGMDTESTTIGVSKCVTWFYKGTASETFSTCGAKTWCTNPGSAFVISPRFTPQDRTNGKYIFIPIPYIRRNFAYKGFGKYFSWAPAAVSVGTTMKKNIPNDILLYKDVAFPWDGTITRN
jgi:hypothetical protein